jgi:eukaryotic-like serine/threonine-protein kinase
MHPPDLRPPDTVTPQDGSPAVGLAAEMARRWRQGERPPAEEFLAAHPHLVDDPDAVFRLVYEELCLRQELGEPADPETLLARFPRWRPQLEVLLECHELLDAERATPVFPEAGERLGEFRLVRELGRGASGRVFLAAQPALAGRLVVLKLVPRDAQEHLNLARLQHTHIVPLYAAYEFADRHLLALCMPSFGGVTLAGALERLRSRSPGRRTGADLVEALGTAAPAGPGRRALARLSYDDAMCWAGACLADALHYAHERGLVHLDVKPANVLLTDDGSPMLLDFHLARAPVRPGDPTAAWLGGTPGYMAPEQESAVLAVRQRRPVPLGVDGRADTYALGVVLYEALGGPMPLPPSGAARQLRRANPAVGVGLADVIGRCLAADPAARYPTAAALAEDLRRHLRHLPLRGVANRSLAERWAKWRRRRPAGVLVLALVLGVLVAVGGGVWRWRNDYSQTEAALAESETRLREGRPEEALRAVGRGEEMAAGLVGGGALRQRLEAQRRLAEAERSATERAQAAEQLHAVADSLRLFYGADSLTPGEARSLGERCRTLWEQRGRIVERLGPDGQERLRADLLDVAVLWGDFRCRAASGPAQAEAHREALQLLTEAEELFGPGPVLYRERETHARALGLTQEADEARRRADALVPRTAWEHYALARALLRDGRDEEAAAGLAAAIDRDPQSFWLRFTAGTCAYRRGRAADAVHEFDVAVALAPREALGRCLVNRGLAQVAAGQDDQALRDYGRALAAEPGLSPAALNRGMLHYRAGRYAEAVADLRSALEHGADPATAHYDLALTYAALKDWPSARASVEQALRHDPTHAGALELRSRLP